MKWAARHNYVQTVNHRHLATLVAASGQDLVAVSDVKFVFPWRALYANVVGWRWFSSAISVLMHFYNVGHARIVRSPQCLHLKVVTPNRVVSVRFRINVLSSKPFLCMLLFTLNSKIANSNIVPVR